MKRFVSRDIFEAFSYADQGGQALHVWKGNWPKRKPRCFRDGQCWGHLIDHDRDRLVATAKRLGVNRVVVSRDGQRGQHVDLCGAPLARAMAECNGFRLGGV